MKKLTVVGIGPGHRKDMTWRAEQALEEADVIVGYKAYVELVEPLFPDKQFYTSGMKQEVDRCQKALELTSLQDNVCVISSGDSGVYGMASLIYELAVDFPSVEIEIVPGITAALSGGALLGAPLGHDFAVISLSDLLTPWEVIERRLLAAAAADFVICLYNPGSRKRRDYLSKACDLLLTKIPQTRVCGVARNIGRAGESYRLTTLGALRDEPTDMFETIFIGAKSTRQIEQKMVTPRGYRRD